MRECWGGVERREVGVSSVGEKIGMCIVYLLKCFLENMVN